MVIQFSRQVLGIEGAIFLFSTRMVRSVRMIGPLAGLLGIILEVFLLVFIEELVLLAFIEELVSAQS